MDTAQSPSGSDTSQAEPPATIPLYERAFGQDPTAFDDPTIYDIREAHDDMTYEEKKAIYNVAQWPPSDLSDRIAGDPPDMDFSNAKPANQVNFSTFQAYLEPYIRPFTEEDVAFLKERADRVVPYVIPQRGSRTYKEAWAIEDGLTGTEAPRREELDPNVPRGGMDEMNDDTAETDEVSMGPVMNRLLSVLRPQPTGHNSRAINDDDANGDTSMVNGEDNPAPDVTAGATEDQRPATALPIDAPRPTNLPAPDYDTFENRALQELKYIGFLSAQDSPAYASHLDDEVAARLRTLQAELRLVSARNNARKGRVLELTEERMAMQEYSNIADDLDNQVNAAYLKRNRSLAKPANKKGGGHSRPGQQRGVAATAGRGVSEGVRALMQKRSDWIEMVGPVVGGGRPPIPGDEETVFDEENMKRFEKAEKEAEAGEVEAE